MTLQITYVECPTNKYAVKCPYAMAHPTYITRHDTANDASAMNEISYMLRNDYNVSFHFAVDYERAVQGIPLNRNAFHAGDGAYGTGNRNSIAIEVCYSKSGGDRYVKSNENSAELTAKLMKQYGIPITNIKKHQDWSGKYCPHRLLSDYGWNYFITMVQNKYNELYGGGAVVNPTPLPTPSGNKYKIGDTVTINGIYTSSNSDRKLTPARTKGIITNIAQNAKNPYLLDNGALGWTNDACIVSGTKPATNSGSNTGTKYSSGTPFTCTGLWTQANGGKWYPKDSLIYKEYTIGDTIYKGAEHPYQAVANGIVQGFANDKCIDDEPSVPSNNGAPTTSNGVVGKKLTLLAKNSAGQSITSWRVYNINTGALVAYLNPAQYGGITYTIEADLGNGWYKITTSMFGQVKIYAGSETPRVIK